MDDVPGLIRSKVRVPSVGAHAIVRPRVTRALESAAAGRRFLLVVASAGWGKTTAAVHLLAARGSPAAWLTLSPTDDTPGRLVTYLAAAVAAVDPAPAADVRRLLRDGLAAEDCAAVLAESLRPGTTVVVDDVHHVDERASVLRVLRAFLDAAPDGVLVVLLSRRLIHLDLGRHVLAGAVGTVSESELAFREREVDDLLAARGLGRRPDAGAPSEGWAAGIVFDALRGGAGRRSAEDPFFAYLGSEVLGGLPDALRAVVLRSAVPEIVTPAVLAALLDDPAPEATLESIVRHHLPGTSEPEGFRYHPRFREYLLVQLPLERPGELRDLRRRHAALLRAEGHAEDAANALLEAGTLAEAPDLAEEAMPTLMRRGDWDRVLRWCEALGEAVLRHHHVLRGAQVRALLMARRQEDVAELVGVMRRTGEFDRLLAVAPDVAGWAVWALHGSGEWRTVERLAPPASSGARARVIRHIMAVGTGRGPAEGFAPEELDRTWPLHVALQSARYYAGDFAAVERLAAAARGRGPVTAALGEIYRIAVLRTRGELGEARAVLDRVAPRVRATRFIEFWQWLEAELLFAEGAREEGLERMREARATSREHRYPVADRAVFAVAEGRMLIRGGRVPEAVELLERSREWSSARGLLLFREWADTWLAAALLALGGDPARPRELLRAAVAGMRSAGRGLELPAAEALRAEAEWRAGDETAHDAAADAAHDASAALGSLAPLLEALETVPEVLRRRVDAAPADDVRWRALAGRPPAPPVTRVEDARVVVRTLGGAGIAVDGRTVAARSPKVVELAAEIARAGTAGADRARLALDLLPDSADAGNALRQLVHRLRRVLPTGVEVVSAAGRLVLLPPGAVVTEDQALEAALARAHVELPGRLDALEAALTMAAHGEYLPSAEGEAAQRRRHVLAAQVADARRRHAEALLTAGRTAEAREEAAAAIEGEPYHEGGWRLLMRCEALLRGPASAVAAFLACRGALNEVGLGPSRETEDLLARLRNAGRPAAGRAVTDA